MVVSWLDACSTKCTSQRPRTLGSNSHSLSHTARACVQMTVVAQGKRGAVRMPMVGFGTAGMSDRTDQAVAWALDSGYRLLDSAQVRLLLYRCFGGASMELLDLTKKHLLLDCPIF